MAEVVKGPGGTLVADGLTCNFKKCGQVACFIDEGTKTGRCVQCRDVSASNPATPVVPNAKTCRMADISHIRKGEGTANVCTLRKGGLLQTSTGQSITLSGDTCFEAVIDCSVVKRCEDYDDVQVYYYDDGYQSNELDDIDPPTLGSICSTDPCEVEKKGLDSKCEWDGNDDCD